MPYKKGTKRKKPLFSGAPGKHWNKWLKHGWNAGRAVTDPTYRFTPKMWNDASAARADQKQLFKKDYG